MGLGPLTETDEVSMEWVVDLLRLSRNAFENLRTDDLQTLELDKKNDSKIRYPLSRKMS